MNEITNQSQQLIKLRAIGVNSKPNLSERAYTGNSLPLAAKVQKNIATQATQKMLTAESISAMQDNVQAAVEEISRYTQSIQRDIQFDIDKSSGRTVVTVIDRTTQEVIRQIPDETFLTLARKLRESLAAGEQNTFHLMSAKA